MTAYSVGVHSGTSMDGINVVLISVESVGKERDKIEVIKFQEMSYPAELRRDVISLASGEPVTLEEVASMSFRVGMAFGDAAAKFIESCDIPAEKIEVIGSAGQTVFHNPQGNTPCTLQVGEGDFIAEKTGIDAVSSFFPRDMAAGGEGAPLMQVGDYMLWSDPNGKENRLGLNTGGIANFVYLRAGGSINDVIAFDTGPCSMLLDALARKLTDGKETCDKDGKRASQGKVSSELLEELMRDSYVNRKPPKSTGRIDFGEKKLKYIMELAEKLGVHGSDLFATLTAFTAESIAYNRRQFIGPVDKTIVYGGGAKNPAIMRLLKEKLENIASPEEFGIPIEAREAIGMAYLAHRRVHGLQTNVPLSTGSRHPVSAGKISLGKVKT